MTSTNNGQWFSRLAPDWFRAVRPHSGLVTVLTDWVWVIRAISSAPRTGSGLVPRLAGLSQQQTESTKVLDISPEWYRTTECFLDWFRANVIPTTCNNTICASGLVLRTGASLETEKNNI